MKYSDLEDVTFLSDLLDNLRRAKSEASVFLKESSHVDPGGIKGFNTGYYCCLTRHMDGSGLKVDLRGLYIGEQIAKATIEVIEKQISKVEKRLIELGVEL